MIPNSWKLVSFASLQDFNPPMDIPQIQNPPIKPPLHWPSLLQLILSVSAALLLLGGAALFIVMGATQLFSQGTNSADPTQYFMMAASLTLAGVLTLPSAWYAGRHLTNPTRVLTFKLERRGYGTILTIVVAILVFLAIYLGNLVSQNNQIAWLLLPPINLLATGLPVLWLVYIGRHGLSSGSRQRTWGIFASGLVLSPALILILELAAIIGILFLAILWVVINPSLSTELNSLAFRLQSAGPNQDAILRILAPYLLRPSVLYTILALWAVIVPLIEETFKPIGVWLLAGQKLTPAEGFVSGLLCGAGFGLFENLGFTSSGSEGWAILATTRMTTVLLHLLTAGLMGWALASAWSQKRYLRLGITFAFSVILHGLWNGMAVISSVASLDTISNVSIPPLIRQIGNLSDIGVVVLGIFNFVLYISFNAALRRSSHNGTPMVSGESASLHKVEPVQPLPIESQDQPSGIITPSSTQSIQTPPATESDQTNLPTNENKTTPTETNP